jgi:ABC-2 type transport system ATP-binding protein
VNRTKPTGDTLCTPAEADRPEVSGPPSVPSARARGLCKAFRNGRVTALDSVDLDLPAGSVTGLLGPNGSGKTTLLRLLLGLSRPTAGTVELLGAPMPARAGEVLAHVGALVERPGYHPYLSGRDNLTRRAVAEPLLATSEVPDAVERALARVELTQHAEQRYHRYSMGMRQRLGLAAVLLVPRRLVILDEPTQGLDPAGTRAVRRIIAEVRAEGSTVLLSSHLLGEVQEVCTHVVVLVDGSVVATGELTALLESDGPALAVRTGEPSAALAALRAARVPGYLEHGQVVAELTDTTPEEVLRILVRADIPVAEARRRLTSLEDLFARITEVGP